MRRQGKDMMPVEAMFAWANTHDVVVEILCPVAGNYAPSSLYRHKLIPPHIFEGGVLAALYSWFHGLVFEVCPAALIQLMCSIAEHPFVLDKTITMMDMQEFNKPSACPFMWFPFQAEPPWTLQGVIEPCGMWYRTDGQGVLLFFLAKIRGVNTVRCLHQTGSTEDSLFMPDECKLEDWDVQCDRVGSFSPGTGLYVVTGGQPGPYAPARCVP